MPDSIARGLYGSELISPNSHTKNVGVAFSHDSKGDPHYFSRLEAAPTRWLELVRLWCDFPAGSGER